MSSVYTTSAIMFKSVLMLGLLAVVFAAEVEVNKPTLTVTNPAKGVKVSLKTPVKLTCESKTDGVSYEFFKGSTKTNTGVSGGVLTITSFSADNKGEYYCTAKRGTTTEKSYTLNLKVGTPGGSVAENSAGQLTTPLLVLSVCALMATFYN